MSKEELKVKPVNQELANDDLKNVHGGWNRDKCTGGLPDGKGGYRSVKECKSRN